MWQFAERAARPCFRGVRRTRGIRGLILFSTPCTPSLHLPSFLPRFLALARGSVLFIFTLFASDKTLHCSPALVFIFVSRAFKLASSILLTLVFIVVQHVFLFKTAGCARSRSAINPAGCERRGERKSYNATRRALLSRAKRNYLAGRRAGERKEERGREFWLGASCLLKIFAL